MIYICVYIYIYISFGLCNVHAVKLVPASCQIERIVVILEGTSIFELGNSSGFNRKKVLFFTIIFLSVCSEAIICFS